MLLFLSKNSAFDVGSAEKQNCGAAAHSSALF
jgi:hypothetical protein